MTALLVGLILSCAGVFLTVVGVVAMIKVIQIAEDLRYIRSKSDIHVTRPKSTKNTLIICAIVSVIVVLVLIILTAGAYDILSSGVPGIKIK